MAEKKLKTPKAKPAKLEIKQIPVYETHNVVPLKMVYDLLGIDVTRVMEAYIEEEDVRLEGSDALVIVERVEKGELEGEVEE